MSGNRYVLDTNAIVARGDQLWLVQMQSHTTSCFVMGYAGANVSYEISDRTKIPQPKPR